MEMSLAYTAPTSYNNGVLRISTIEKTSRPSSSTTTTLAGSRRRAFPLIQASKTTPSSRPTLSSNWDVAQNLCPATSSAPAWLPRLEDLDTTNMILRQRIIFLGSQVDDVTADFVISQLLFLDAEDSKKDIKLFINSPGGSVTAGMGIYDAMKLCKADVSTVCFGLAASMGAFLLASGTQGKRFCMPNARVMIHQPLGTAGGKATEMGIRIREMVYHKIKLNKIFSRVTGKPYEQVELDTDRDNFMNPWEAKEYGLIDHVIDDGKPGLVAPVADAAPPPKTKVWDMWKVEGSRKAKKNLPSENKILENKNGYKDGQPEKETPRVSMRHEIGLCLYTSPIRVDVNKYFV